VTRSAYLRLDRPSANPVRLTRADFLGDLEQTYRAMAALTSAEPDRWAAWKLGGTNAASRAAFQVERLYYGAIARDEILFFPHHAPGASLVELKGEVEIALRIAPDGYSHDAWAIALEMPASPLVDLVDLGVVALVADRCAAGSLVLGPIRTGLLPQPDDPVSQDVDGVRMSDGAPSRLTAPPETLLHEFLALAREHGAPVSPGDWVATGGMTACITYEPGQHVVVRFRDQVEIDVTIKADMR